MRVMVAGGAGFLGSHLADRHLDQGDEVVAVDNLVTGNWENLADRPGLTKLTQDVAEAFAFDGPLDLVYHLASPASPRDFARIPLEIAAANSLGTWNLLRLCEAKSCRFLMASTSEVYGDPAVTPQPESYWGNVNPIGERSPYDEGKRFSEALSTAFSRSKGLDVRIVRYFNTYGPRIDPDDGRAVPTFIVQALSGAPLTVQGDGKQTRSFGYVDDVIRGTMALGASVVEGPVNIGNDGEFSLLELAAMVIEVTGSSSPIVHVPAAPDDPRQRRPDLTRARTLLGYEPTTPLREGLEATVAWFRTRT